MKKYLAIKGTLPRERDISEWNEEHFLQFFAFVNDLCEVRTKDGKSDTTIKITEEKMKALEDEVNNTTPTFKTEIMYRIDQFHSDPTATPRKMFYKLNQFIKQVGHYVKKHPSVVTDKIKEAIEPNPRLNWILKLYQERMTKLGNAAVVEPYNINTTKWQNEKTPSVATPQVKLMEAMTHLADVFVTLSKSISAKDIKKMDAKDKLSAISKLSFVLGEARRFKPNVAVFQQINVNSAAKEDLENALLDFAKHNEKE